MKIKINKLGEIEACLNNTLLPIKGTGLNYEITKNLVKIRRVIEEWNSVWDKTRDSFLIKNSKNEDAYFVQVVGAEGKMEFLKDAAGNFVEVSEKTKLEDGQSMSKRIDLTVDFFEATKKHHSEEVEIEFHVFNKEKTKKLFEDGTFDGLNLTPLFGVLIEEHE
jgi:hypothetical protein